MRALETALFGLYPVLVWCGLRWGTTRTTALVLLAVTATLALLRWRRGGAQGTAVLALPLVGIGLLAGAAALDNRTLVLALPIAVNGLLLGAFAATLRPGRTPMIERFARLAEGDLPEPKVAWCRAWTRVWCGFFLGNGLAALALVLWAPLSWWTLYNGFVAYLLIALLIGLEIALRRLRFGRGDDRAKV